MKRWILALLLLCGPAANAATYYVRTDGNDANDGSANNSANALATVAHALSHAAADDVITINVGDYTAEGTISSVRSGTSGHFIKITSTGGAAVVKKFTINHDDIWIDALTFTNTTTLAKMIEVPSGSAGGNRLKITNCTFNGGADRTTCIYIKASPTSADGVLVQGNLFIGVGIAGAEAPYINVTVTHSTFTGNEFSNIASDVYYVWGHALTITHNYVHDAYSGSNPNGYHTDFVQTFGPGSCYDVLFAYNRMINCMGQPGNMETKLAVNQSGWVVRNNLFYHVQGTWNWGLPGAVIVNNTFYDVGYSTTLNGKTIYFLGPPDYDAARFNAEGCTFQNNVVISRNMNISGVYFSSGLTETRSYNYYSLYPTYASKAVSITETGGVNGGDPHFVDLATFNLRIGSAGSPLDGAGVDLTASFTDDFDGNTRPSGSAWCIGYHEYGASGGSDITPPVITAITTSTVTATTATITWTTDEASDTQIEYGTSAAYGSATTKIDTGAGMLTAHAQSITGLTAGTTYHYRVRSADASANVAYSNDYSFMFATTPTTGTITVRGSKLRRRP